MAIHRVITLCGAFCLGAAASLGAQVPQASPLKADGAAHDSTPSVLIGHVVDTLGTGLAGAEITMLKSDRVHVITGDSGDFRIVNLPPGTIVFNVRRIGFEAATFTAVLKPGKTSRTNFRLTAAATTLPTVAVSDTATKTHWLDVFERRKSGSRGTFITRADIEKSTAHSGSDIVRMVPGVRVDQSRGPTTRITMTRGNGVRACVPTMYVHGMQYSGTLDDFTAEDIEALEVYVGVSEIPPELDKVGKGVCGVIVVWTRDPRKKP